IVLTEDHLVVRNGNKVELELVTDFRVIAEASSGQETLELLEGGLQPDIIMTDLNMGQMDGFQLLDEVSSRFPAIRLVILTMLNREQHVLKAFQEGPQGYLVKNVSAEDLIFAIQH